MRDLRAAKILGHERNIQRHCRLLATEITELERQYLHKQIAEERAELERWSRQFNQKTHPMSSAHAFHRTSTTVSRTLR